MTDPDTGSDGPAIWMPHWCKQIWPASEEICSPHQWNRSEEARAPLSGQAVGFRGLPSMGAIPSADVSRPAG